jgi:PST family polysaccharide transporter
MTSRAVSGVFWTVIQSWGGRVVSTLVFVALGRLLDPEDFGLVSLGSVLIELGALVTVSGFHRAIVQREELEPGHLDAAFWSSVAIGSALCGATLLSAGWISDLLDEPKFAPVLRALSLTFLITAVGAVPSALLHRRMAFKAFAVRQLLSITVGSCVGVALAFAGAGAWALVGQSLTSAACSTVVVLVNARWRPRMRFSGPHWRELARYGRAALGIDVLDFVSNRFDDLLIGLVLGTTALGYYGVAYRTYAIALEVISYSLSAVAFPIFSRIISDHERARRALLITTKFAVCIIVPVFVGLTALADQALVGLFGPQWRPAVAVLRILCVGAALSAGIALARDVVLAAGSPRLELKRLLLASVLLCIAFVVGVQWGLAGVAYGRVAVVVLMVPIEAYILHRVLQFDVRSYLLSWIRPLPAVAAMLVVVLGMRHVFDPPVNIGWLAGLSVAGGAAYLIVLWFTARTTVQELVGRVRDRHL